MSEDALAYLVEAFGHVSDAELKSFLDGAPASPLSLSDPREAAPVIAVPADVREPAQAA